MPNGFKKHHVYVNRTSWSFYTKITTKKNERGGDSSIVSEFLQRRTFNSSGRDLINVLNSPACDLSRLKLCAKIHSIETFVRYLAMIVQIPVIVFLFSC